ncbi:MAG: glycosyltransferase [bacterium]|nr:glycosyltransferase [bacterium]
MKLSIAIPVYNEEGRLPVKLAPYLEYLEKHLPDYELIFVDDGSTDGTLKFLDSLATVNSRVKIIHNTVNRGRGFGMRAGVLAASGEYVLETDADLPVSPEYIDKFIDFLAANPDVGLIMGSRELPGSIFVLGQPPLRVFAGKVFHIIFGFLFGVKFKDVMCGFKMFRQKVAKDIFHYVYDDKYLAAGEVIYVAHKFGYKIKEAPISWEDDRRSKVFILKDSFRTLLGMWNLTVRNLRGKYRKK